MKKIHRDLLNAGIAGALLFFGAFINGGIDTDSIIAAAAAAVITFLINCQQIFKTTTIVKKKVVSVKGVFQFI
jgi:hypothetical protein